MNGFTINPQVEQLQRLSETEDLTPMQFERLEGSPNNIDALTGLQCRSNFEIQKLSASFNRAVKAAMLIDFDQFAQVNDNYGRVTGDFILSKQAERLQAQYAHVGMLYRYEGDRFLMAITAEEGTESPELLTALAEKVQQTLNQPIRLSQAEAVISCCIGLVLKEKNMSLGLLATEALIATEEAKSKAKNSLHLSRGFHIEGLLNAMH